MEALKKILNVITTAVIAVVVVCGLALVGGKPFGYHPYTVLSGSMEPTYPTGSLIYVEEVADPAALMKGDVITYMIDRDTTVTHRINDIVVGEDGQMRFETKGDANDYADEALVHPDNVIGTPVFSVPKVGYLLEAIKEPPGTYIAVTCAAVLVFLMFLPDLLPEGKKRDEDEGGEEEGEKSRKNAREGDEDYVPRGKHARNAVAPAPARNPRAAATAAPAQAYPQQYAHQAQYPQASYPAYQQPIQQFHQYAPQSQAPIPSQAQPYFPQQVQAQPHCQPLPQAVNPLYQHPAQAARPMQAAQPTQAAHPVRPAASAPRPVAYPGAQQLLVARLVQPVHPAASPTQAPRPQQHAAPGSQPDATVMFKPAAPGAVRQMPPRPTEPPRKQPTVRRRTR